MVKFKELENIGIKKKNTISIIIVIFEIFFIAGINYSFFTFEFFLKFIYKCFFKKNQFILFEFYIEIKTIV